MEKHVVPPEVAAELAATKKDNRNAYTPDIVRVVTDIARHNGCQSASNQYLAKNDVLIPVRSIQTWLQFFKTNGTYFDPQRRGRKRILNDEEEAAVVSNLAKIRAAPHCRSVLATTTAAVSRGILARSRPGLLEKQGGPFKMGREYGRQLMLRNKWAKRAKTSDRTVPDAEVIAAAGPFFVELKRLARVVPPSLLINMDEFCMLLDGQSKWTWQPMRQPGGVAIRDCKLAFTTSVVTNAEGAILLLQLIFNGLTVNVHADVPAGGKNKRILQDHQATSHYQDKDTFARFVDWLIQHVAHELPKYDESARALLLLDDAPQHWVPEVVAKAKENCIDFLRIPPKMTHIFQPADQFIIADLRRKVTKSWQNWIETLFASRPGDAAVSLLCSTSIPVLRRRMYTYLSNAIDSLGPEPVIASWKISGIIGHAYGKTDDTLDNAERLAEAADSCIDLPDCIEDCNSDMRLRRCQKCGEFVCEGCWLDHNSVTCGYLE